MQTIKWFLTYCTSILAKHTNLHSTGTISWRHDTLILTFNQYNWCTHHPTCLISHASSLHMLETIIVILLFSFTWLKSLSWLRKCKSDWLEHSFKKESDCFNWENQPESVRKQFFAILNQIIFKTICPWRNVLLYMMPLSWNYKLLGFQPWSKLVDIFEEASKLGKRLNSWQADTIVIPWLKLYYIKLK